MNHIITLSIQFISIIIIMLRLVTTYNAINEVHQQGRRKWYKKHAVDATVF